MSQFKYSFYHITNPKVENEFEPLFREFRNQIHIYHRQFNLTSKAYVSEWENELKSNEKKYQSEKSKAEIIYKDAFKDNIDDEFAHSYAMNVSGLEMISNHYHNKEEEIDNEYKEFLDLYSKSILIALYSLNESKLNEIIEVASTVFKQKIKPSHLSARDYLKSAILYLNLVIEIDTQQIETYISKLIEIQFLRNGIVHNASIFSEFETASNIAKKYKDSLQFKKGINSIKIIKSSFIKDFFQLLVDFFEELFWLLDLRQDSIIIKNGLSHWLGILDREIWIKSIKFDKNTKIEKIISFIAVSKELDIKEFRGKITLKKSKKKSFEYINQTGNKSIEDFLEYQNKLEGNYMMDIFKPFDINYSAFEKKIIVF